MPRASSTTYLLGMSVYDFTYSQHAYLHTAHLPLWLLGLRPCAPTPGAHHMRGQAGISQIPSSRKLLERTYRTLLAPSWCLKASEKSTFILRKNRVPRK